MSDRRETERIVGVRVQGEGDLSYCLLPSENGAPATGDLLVVERDGCELIGRVVIAPDQFVRADLPDRLPKVLRVAQDEDAGRERAGAYPDPGKPEGTGQQVGGPGPIPRAADTRGEHSAEDLRYRATKANFPAIGERVRTPEGAGIVLAVNTSRSTLNIRLDEDSTEHTFDAVDVMTDKSSARSFSADNR
ncbi:MAG TPA: hypothetical protein VNZ55_04950 [Thermomicrobiales bacterium]|nr:hypothetical protein [Thermomicrobiales bacterium]